MMAIASANAPKCSIDYKKQQNELGPLFSVCVFSFLNLTDKEGSGKLNKERIGDRRFLTLAGNIT